MRTKQPRPMTRLLNPSRPSPVLNPKQSKPLWQSRPSKRRNNAVYRMSRTICYCEERTQSEPDRHETTQTEVALPCPALRLPGDSIAQYEGEDPQCPIFRIQLYSNAKDIPSGPGM